MFEQDITKHIKNVLSKKSWHNPKLRYFNNKGTSLELIINDFLESINIDCYLSTFTIDEALRKSYFILDILRDDLKTTGLSTCKIVFDNGIFKFDWSFDIHEQIVNGIITLVP